MSETEDEGVDHLLWTGGWYCHIHAAGFEPQELERNGGDCPYCGQPVDSDYD